MRNVIVNVGTTPTDPQTFPGQVWAGIDIGLGDFPKQRVTAATYSATFLGVPAGSYVMTAQAVDTEGQPMGPELTGQADVVDVDVPRPLVDIPAGLSFTLA